MHHLPRFDTVGSAGQDADEWDAIARPATEDLLVYLALDRFRRRPPMSALPIGLQRDIRAFFGSYASACRLADDRLFQAGDAEAVNDACRRSDVGKLLPNALYLHRSALESLDPRLRVYEGCARAYLGEVEGANLIKLHRQSGKVSYLVYPDFETDPHPALLRSIKLNLRTREIESTDYAQAQPAGPPPQGDVPASRSPVTGEVRAAHAQEERAGLLDETATIGTREGWAERLRTTGYALRGHRLVRNRTGD